MHSKRPRVCRHHAHMCFNMRAWCQYTRGRLERTHGGVLNVHTEAFLNVHTETPHTPHNTDRETQMQIKFGIEVHGNETNVRSLWYRPISISAAVDNSTLSQFGASTDTLCEHDQQFATKEDVVFMGSPLPWIVVVSPVKHDIGDKS